VNYVEHHFGDYAKDTRHLSVTAHGAYRLLMDIYYIKEKKLPASIDECCRLLSTKTAVERQAVKSVLSEFFDLTEEGWLHKRCEIEIERYRDKQNKAKRSANARWNFTSTHTERNADAMRTHTEGNAPNHQSPITSNQTPDTREKKKTTSPTAPPDVDPKVWADWTQLRKNKRAPVTNTALDGLRREAQKAGLSLEAALRLACERGWMGFKAEWLEDRRTINGSHSKQSALEERNRQAGEEWLRRHDPPREPEIFDAIATERSS
jgi:uncharacterized protein YdaU (DUF1376 family)